MSKNKKLKVTLMRSKYNCQASHASCITGLGLRRIRHSVIVDDTPSVRGMINKIAYLVKVEEVQ